MELAQVKAAVKVWEKAFKAKNKREPTKDDIKRDSTGIAEQYALYRKLSKVSSGSSSAGPSSSSQPPSSSASTGTTGLGSQRTTTPRIIPNSEYPTTPTPPARRTYVQRPHTSSSSTGRNASTEAVPDLETQAGPSQPKGLKRTASKANLQPPSPGPVPSTSLGTFLTPRKPKQRPEASPGYTGPVLDPNPLNPFLASPSRARKSPFGSAGKPSLSSTPYTMEPSTTGNGRITSPFIHASSPRKLKEVLEANSLRNVKARMGGLGSSPSKVDITPRTRARKRLRGEVVDDTPGKPAQGVRRKRGQRDEGGSKEGKEAMMREDVEDEEMDGVDERDGNGAMEVMQEAEDEEDDDDGMGPSPLKPINGGRVFTSFSDMGEMEKGTGAKSQSLKERLDAASKNVPKFKSSGKEKDKGKGKASGSKEVNGKQTKMNTFFQRTEKVPKKSTVPEPPITTKGKQKSTVTTSSSVPPRSSSNTANGKFLSSRLSPHPSHSPADEIPDIQPDTYAWNSPIPQSPTPGHIDSDPIERLPTPPLGPDIAADPQTLAQPRSAPRGSRTVARLMASSDEDEPGTSASASREDREIVIVPTRRAVAAKYARRRGSLDSIGSIPDDLNDEEIAEEEADEEGFEGEDSSSPPSPTLPPHLLSLLSLRSPTKSITRHKSELVVKALFDPEAARRLRAIQRGQDVRVGGVDVEDAEKEGEEDMGLDRFDAEEEGEGGEGGAYADDDWEEEDEGWKRPGEDMDEGW